MTTNAITPDYHGEFKDSREKFGGNILVYIGWDHHLFHCSARAFPLPPEMPFGALTNEVIPDAFSQHPEFEKVQWNKTQWLLNGEPFAPDFNASLEAQGFDHKSVLRFITPELKGYADAGI